MGHQKTDTRSTREEENFFTKYPLTVGEFSFENLFYHIHVLPVPKTSQNKMLGHQ